jgi:ubiquinone/menaquinone biosynthesis C-methylase UbiE
MYAAAPLLFAAAQRMTVNHSPTQFDARAAAQLERMYSSAQVVAQRTRFRAVLAARAGETGVDVGCGLAYLTLELAQDVAPGGRIIAFDNSEHMVGEAAARVAAAGLDDAVTVRHGDATALELDDASVDFVVAAQVYSYVPQVARAVAEAARVLKPGGRLAVLETDWDLCTYESADPELSRRMLAARAQHFAHPHLPRQLHRLMRGAGLRLSRCEAVPIVETRFDPESFGAGMLPVVRSAARQSGIDAAAIDRWIADIRSRTADGDYFFATFRFVFVAEK